MVIEMLEKIKKTMRISHNSLDDVINEDIESCKSELQMHGVYCNEEDQLLCKACELYVKWQSNYAGKGEQFEKAYRKLSDAMALCGDYNVRPVD